MGDTDQRRVEQMPRFTKLGWVHFFARGSAWGLLIAVGVLGFPAVFFDFAPPFFGVVLIISTLLLAAAIFIWHGIEVYWNWVHECEAH